MPRLPFDPDRVSSPRDSSDLWGCGASANPQSPRPLTVTQVAGLVKDVLAQGIPDMVRVVGEVSNFSSRTHWFFSLKDEAATLRCVCFASAARKVGFDLGDGMQVVATGRLDFFPAQGHLQLYVDKIEPVGQGALELKLRQLLAELRQLGYFDEVRKKPLPVFARKVAVVTSRTGAALQDVINTTHRRWPGCRLYLVDVHVQGAEAAPEIVRAIDALARHGPAAGINAIILTRGGGSMEDLWAFNERSVADAVFRCPIPIVAAIGHETDTTVAELVADVRASTPTQAAMMLIPDCAALEQQMEQFTSRLALLVRRNVQQSRQHLESLARQPLFRKPALAIQPLRQRVEQMNATLQAALPRLAQMARQRLEALLPRWTAALPRLLQTERQRLDALARQLQAVSPTHVLQRGYSYTLGPDGRVLKYVRDAVPGERITTVLADGKVHSRVESSLPSGEEDEHSEPGEDASGCFGPAPAADRSGPLHTPSLQPSPGCDAVQRWERGSKSGRRKKPVADDQPGLFS